MHINETENSTPDLISQIRPFISRKSLFADDLFSIRRELRQRRKRFLGSHVSLQEIIFSSDRPKEYVVSELSHYLTCRTLHFWLKDDLAREFCNRFYEVALYAISSGEVGGESVDDIIQLAECLIRSRKVFVDVVKKLLSDDMIADLFALTEAYPDSFYSASFEDSVLGAVSVFLGALKDPCENKETAEGDNL